MTHRGPFQSLLFCDSVKKAHEEMCSRTADFISYRKVRAETSTALGSRLLASLALSPKSKV